MKYKPISAWWFIPFGLLYFLVANFVYGHIADYCDTRREKILACKIVPIAEVLNPLAIQGEQIPKPRLKS